MHSFEYKRDGGEIGHEGYTMYPTPPNRLAIAASVASFGRLFPHSNAFTAGSEIPARDASSDRDRPTRSRCERSARDHSGAFSDLSDFLGISETDCTPVRVRVPRTERQYADGSF